jgi:hypothetical protein
MKTDSSPEPLLWLISRRADFWLASAGASIAIITAVIVILWHGDREIDSLDFVLSEFHLGATYEAVVRRRLWRHMPADVLIAPLAIIAITYVLSMSEQTILLTSIAMYAAVWHRGRQSLGVARFYQRTAGGPTSRPHDVLFRGAIYLPMAAATLAYTYLAPTQYDGEPYLALNLGAELTATAGVVAAVWVIAYFTWTLGRHSGVRLIHLTQKVATAVHPGEWWVVLAHAVAFGSGYVLGASSAAFLLILAVHHEVQYLYFAYAMARRSATLAMQKTEIEWVANQFDSKASQNAGGLTRAQIRFTAWFLLWPIVGFAGALVGSCLQLGWLGPLGIGGLFCHYWLDGRIWTKQAFRN